MTFKYILTENGHFYVMNCQFIQVLKGQTNNNLRVPDRASFIEHSKKQKQTQKIGNKVKFPK